MQTQGSLKEEGPVGCKRECLNQQREYFIQQLFEYGFLIFKVIFVILKMTSPKLMLCSFILFATSFYAVEACNQTFGRTNKARKGIAIIAI